MLTQSQVQDSRTEQVVKYQIQTKRQTSHTRHTIKKKRKKDKTSLPPVSTQTQTTCMREESHPKRQNKKEKPHDTFPPHQPASPRDLAHRPTIQSPAPHTQSLSYTTHTPCLHLCHHPYLHPTRILPTRLPTLSYTPTPTMLPPIVTVPPPVSTPYPQLHLCLSRSRYRSPSTCALLPDGRYALHRLSTHCSPVPSTQLLLSAYCSHVCLHYCAHSFRHHAYRLGFSPCAHHDPSSSPSNRHPGHLRYHQSLTRVHSHSLPVPPPLPLADARSQGGSTVGRSRSLACGLWRPLVCMVCLSLAGARSAPAIHVHTTTVSTPC